MRTPTPSGLLRARLCHHVLALCGLVSFGLLAGCQTLDVFSHLAQPTPASVERDEDNQTAQHSAWGGINREFAARTDAVNSIEASLSESTQPVEHSDAWDEARSLLRLQPPASKRIDRAIKFYAGKQRFFDRIAGNADTYLPYIIKQIKRRGLPGEIALLPIIESAYYPYAVSPSNAAGLWQFIPSTGKQYGLKQSWWYDARRDVVASTDAAIEYLEYLNRRVDGDWLLTLAAFNAGEGTIERAIKKNRAAGKPTDYWSLQLPRETSLYVPRLLAIAAIVKDPGAHRVKLEKIPNVVGFAEVDVGRQVDLALVGKIVGTDLEHLYSLNPGFKQWANDPGGPYRVLVPAGSEEKLVQHLEKKGPETLVSWHRHEIQRNDTLSGIAKRYHTSVSTLKTLNGLNSHKIRAGKTLIVPASALAIDAYPLAQSHAAEAKHKVRGDGKKRIYTIRHGDNLWTIARTHDIRVKDITRWNGIGRKTPLQPGQELTLWLPVSKTAAVTEATSIKVSSANLATLQPVLYTIRNGDSLWTISRKFQVTVGNLRKWNDLTKDALLQPGQTLQIYVANQPTQVES